MFDRKIFRVYNTDVNVKVKISSMKKNDLLRIGDLARATGKTTRALRYYEELGLLRPASHSQGGFRLYRQEDIKRVELIDRLQQLGLSLDHIREIIAAWEIGESGEDVATELIRLLQKSLQDVHRQMAKLKKMEGDIVEALQFLVTCSSCEDQPSRETCTACDKGDHEKRLPSIVDALVPYKRAHKSPYLAEKTTMKGDRLYAGGKTD